VIGGTAAAASYWRKATFGSGSELVILAGRARATVWTYDSNFAKLWRLPNGKHVPLAVGRL
jgi:hypothetical protein